MSHVYPIGGEFILTVVKRSIMSAILALLVDYFRQFAISSFSDHCFQ
jgi:hypothetical protein